MKKTCVINGKSRSLTSPSEGDLYFQMIIDNIESDFAAFCKRFIRSGDLCWDVGCNLGVTTLIMSDFNPDGRIVAIDANQLALEAYATNMAENGVGHVKVVHAAVGAQDGETTFISNSGFGAVSEAGQPVRMVSPSTLIEAGGGCPDVVKMDVEGYEPFILKAAAPAFIEHGTLVYFEFNTWCLLSMSRVQPLDFLEWLSDTFEYTFVEAAGTLTPFGRADCVNLLHANLTKQPYQFLDNIVVCSSSGRL